MITLQEIQTRIVDAMKQSDMSQAKIAAAIGVSQQSVSRYINGKKLPGLDTLANLCKLLGLDANYILCQED